MPRKAKLRVTLKTRNDLNTFTFRLGKFKLAVWERPDALYEGAGVFDRLSWGAIEQHMSDVARSIFNGVEAHRRAEQGIPDVNDPIYRFLHEVIDYLKDIER